MEIVGQVWDTILLGPMINILIVLSSVLFNNFGLTIIVLTFIFADSVCVAFLLTEHSCWIG